MTALNTDDLARRYMAGETLQSIAKSLGVSMTPVRTRLIKAGVEIRSRACDDARRVAVPPDAVAAYQAGESELSVSKRFGVSRPTLRRHLEGMGVVRRGGSEANLLRMARMSPEDRLALTEKAHAAVRGKPKTFEDLCNKAVGREAKPVPLSPHEATFLGLVRFKAPGLRLDRQRAVGPYNLDFALAESRIAVEIFGGHWHAAGPHAARYRKRMDYLINADWLPVVIWVTGQWPMTGFASDYVVTLHERVRRGEPRGRQEHVIRGNGDLGPVGEFKPHNGAVVMNFHPRNGVRGVDWDVRE